MGHVCRLSEELANQIAAGEVVERPASVVKELVENAIDARATRVDVHIDGGGVSLIRVRDDGAGMSEDDAKLSLERHATSKIASIEDLTGIGTYGFRGEALPSIASVSRLLLRTRLREEDTGTEISLEGGNLLGVKPCGTSAGTTVEVRDLFFNVPARRKFLRALPTESAHVADVLRDAALARPDLTFTLVREGRTAREYLRAKSHEERVRAIFEEEHLSACQGERGPLAVRAFLSKPERARSGATGLSLFVNDRCVRDRSLARAVAQAYGSVLEPGRYPTGAVYLTLRGDLVDVNVHPQKAEVRFADGRAVSDALFRILSEGLARAFGMPVPARSWSAPPPQPGERRGADLRPPSESFPPASAPPSPGWSERSHSAHLPAIEGTPARELLHSVETPLPSPLTAGERVQASAASTYPVFVDRPNDVRPRFSELRFLGQLRQTFLLCEGGDGLYVLDQHASAERVTFHRLRSGFSGRAMAMQTLLFPLLVELSARDADLIQTEQEHLLQLGLDVRAVAPTRVAIHAVPQLLTRAKPEVLLHDFLAETTRSGGRAFSGAVDLVLATMACHGSVRAGDRVDSAEALALLQALDEVDFAGHCPHGRPVLTRLSFDELERKVGRR